TTITLEELTPARCCMAPEIPTATYNFGLMAIPVCPTCSECGLQPASDTGFEQAVAAPSASASSSINPQFSGPFMPRPAETTISASGKDILSEEAAISPKITSAALLALSSW